MEALNIRNEIRAVSLDIYRGVDTVSHPALLSKLSTYGIQGQLHSWITDFLHSLSHRVALNGTLSSPLPVKAGVPQSNVIGHKLFVIFINDLTDSGKSSISADDSTLCHDISHPSDRRAEVSPLSSDLDKITNWSNTV